MWTSPKAEADRMIQQEKDQMETFIQSFSQQQEQQLNRDEEATADGETVQTILAPSLAKVETSMSTLEVSFDTDKMLNCSVENENTLVHGAGGRGYGLASIPIFGGCYQWKVRMQLIICYIYNKF